MLKKTGILVAAAMVMAIMPCCIINKLGEPSAYLDRSFRVDSLPCCILEKHAGKVIHVCFAPQSNRLVSLSEDAIDRSTILVWHAASGAVIDSFTNKSFLDTDVEFSADGNTIGIGSRTAVLFHADDYKLKRAFEPETYEFFKAIDVSPNLSWPFALKTYRVEQKFRYVTSIGFSPDGRYLVSGHENGQVKIWEIKTGDMLNVLWGTKVFGGVLDVEFSPDGRFIAACQDDEKIRVWRFPDCVEMILEGHERAVYSIDFNPVTGHLFSAGVDGDVRIWDIERGRTLNVIEAHEKAILSVTITEDGRTLVTGSKDNTVRIWEIATGRRIAVLTGNKRQVNSVALNSNATLLVSGSDDMTVRIWDISALQLCENIALTPVPLYPATLTGNVVFVNDTGNGVLSPGERARFSIRIRNEGEGAAFNIVTLAIPDTLTVGMDIQTPELIPMLLPGREAAVVVKVSNNGTSDMSGLGFTFRILESNGFHLNPPLKSSISSASQNPDKQ